jgi:hypothetical protein
MKRARVLRAKNASKISATFSIFRPAMHAVPLAFARRTIRNCAVMSSNFAAVSVFACRIVRTRRQKILATAAADSVVAFARWAFVVAARRTSNARAEPASPIQTA